MWVLISSTDSLSKKKISLTDKVFYRQTKFGHMSNLYFSQFNELEPNKYNTYIFI